MHSPAAVDQALLAAAEHLRTGRLGAAEAIYRGLLDRYPNHPQALLSLGALLLDTGRLQESTGVFRHIVRLWPNEVSPSMTLGYLFHVQGALNDAADIYVRLLHSFPDSDEICNRLGNVERSRGNLGQAVALFRRAVAARPSFWEARNNLGLALEEAGDPVEAARVLEEAVRLDPGHAEVYFNLAISQTTLGRLEAAAASYRRATDLNPGFAEAFNNLGAALKLLGKLDDSIAAFEMALRLRPGWAAVESNLAGVYEWQARHDEALACHRRAMAIAPDDPVTHGNYLYTLLFHPACDAAALRAEHDAWNRRHARQLGRAAGYPDNDRTPDRRLRIGYIGALFRDHVVGRNLLPLFREHDREAVEMICYSNNRANDSMTQSFRELASGWREIARLSDADAAALIRRDRVDILVDTTLHMEGSRLMTLARKPAPIQVTFAGYPGSTGLPAIDYRLTDPHLDPPAMHEAWYEEHSWRLPDSFWCYDPLGADVAVSSLPADREGQVTFGCLNNFSKVNDAVLELWARVLRETGASRLLILSCEGSHRQRALGVLKTFGIDSERVEFAGLRPRRLYLELFKRVDISLDTLPYNGHTTGLDSLWMGVPVVTLVGRTVVGRAGFSQLRNLQLPELIARTPEEYVSIATELALDREGLRRLRRTLRSRMERSPLMDAPAFARGIEHAYRGMWRRWCAGMPPAAGP